MRATTERSHVVDFSYPIWYFREVGCYNHQYITTLGPRLPSEYLTHHAVRLQSVRLVCMVCSPISLRLGNWRSHSRQDCSSSSYSGTSEVESYNLAFLCRFCETGIINQSTDQSINPQHHILPTATWALQIGTTTWTFLSMIITLHYQCRLSSQFAVPRAAQQPLHSRWELLGEGRMQHSDTVYLADALEKNSLHLVYSDNVTLPCTGEEMCARMTKAVQVCLHYQGDVLHQLPDEPHPRKPIPISDSSIRRSHLFLHPTIPSPTQVQCAQQVQSIAGYGH